MGEETKRIFREYTWSLRAFLDINVHKTFYDNIKENEIITLVCKNKEKMEIITTNGFSFAIFSNDFVEIEYVYYAIRAGAVFKGYISDIQKSGAFVVHISQYVNDDYKNPKKGIYTVQYTNAGGFSKYRKEERYDTEFEGSDNGSVIFVVAYLALMIIFAVLNLEAVSIILLCAPVFLIPIIGILKDSGDSNLKKQIDERMYLQAKKIKEEEEERRRIREEQRKRQEQVEIERKQQAELERQGRAEVKITRGNITVIIPSSNKTDKSNCHKSGAWFDNDGFDKNGIHRNGTAYDDYGYDRSGFDKKGFDKEGKHRNGTLYDDDGFDVKGYDRYGFNHVGVQADGSSYDKYGYDRYGYNCTGYDREGYDRKGYNFRGFNKNGIHRNGTKYDNIGYDAKGNPKGE